MSCSIKLRHPREAKATLYLFLFLLCGMATVVVLASPESAFAADMSDKVISQEDPGKLDLGNWMIKGLYGICSGLATWLMSFASEFWNIIAKGQFIGGDLASSTFKDVRDVVHSVINDVIVPISQGFLGFMLAFELLKIEHDITSSSSAKNLGLGSFEQFIFFAIKYAALYEVINHIYAIMYGIFSIFNWITVNVQDIVKDYNLSQDTITANMFDSSFQSLTYGDAGAMIVLVIAAAFCLGIIAWTCLYGQVLAISRIFEIFILIAFSAIPITTFANSRLNNIGTEFIKTFCGACLQLAIIYVIVGIGGPLISSVSRNIGDIINVNSDGTLITLVMTALVPTICCIAMYQMLKSSRMLSQKIFGNAT